MVMTEMSGSARPSWIDKKFRSNVPPGKRALAKALQEVCRHLTPDRSSRNRITQAKAAEHLGCSESSLSRFLSGQSLPGLQLVEGFYKQACADAGNENVVGFSLEELRTLHSEAEAERCHSCIGQAAEVEDLTRQLQEMKSECASLRQEVAELALLRRDMAEQKAVVAKLRAARAGLQARLAARTSSAPLPVPGRRGDRQRMRNDVAAAQLLARQAGELDRNRGPEAALTLLRQTTEALSPREMATLLLLLRQQQDDQLADNVIHIYGRDQSDQDVLHATLALHEHGATEDAGAMLRAALT
ncbi:helix-turn-helix domain-containing protein [Streptomyces sp. NPDC000851]